MNVAVSEKRENDSLVAMWDAYQRVRSNKDEKPIETARVSPWGAKVADAELETLSGGSVEGIESSHYWSKLYQTEGSTTTLSIFLPDGTLLATVEGNGSATTTSIIHTDHLNSVAFTSDKNGTLSELSAYYPYGPHRITDLPSSGANVERGYIGQYEDGATTLSYLQARYYDGTRGQFLSVDPVFLRDPNRQNLANPQSFNSYAYANGNPVGLSDPSGEAGGPPSRGSFSSGNAGTLAWASASISWAQQVVASISAQVAARASGESSKSSGGGAGGGGGGSWGSGQTIQKAASPSFNASGFANGFIDPYGSLSVVADKNISLDYRMSTLGGMVTGFAGGGELGAVGKGVKQLNPGILMKERQLDHVLEKHLLSGSRYENGVSYFNEGEDIAELIRQGTQQQMIMQSAGNYERVFDAGRVIGFDAVTGGDTTVMTIITNSDNALVTSFPGMPTYRY